MVVAAGIIIIAIVYNNINFFGINTIGEVELQCPLDRVRLIHSNDVASSSVQHGAESFSSLLSPMPNFDEGYFHSFNIPNIGELVFKDELILLGLTTQGYRVSSFSYYVSDFTLQYSNSTNEGEDYKTYPEVCLL